MTKLLTALRRMLLALALALGTGYTSLAQVVPQPLALTGFNADIVANGTGQTAASASASDADGGGNYFPSVDYTTSGAPGFFHPTMGLPFGQGFLSTGTPNVRFNLAGYGGNNALRLTGTTSGTLTLATPTAANTLYVLATGGGVGNAPANNLRLTVNFANGSSQVFARIVPDWYSVNVPSYHTTTAYTLNTRVNTGNSFDVVSSNPKLFQLVLPIDPAAAGGSAVTSILAEKLVAAGIIQVMAVSAASGAYTPVPLTLPAATTPTATSATGQDVVANGTSQASPNNSAVDIDGAGYFLVASNYTKSQTTTPTTVTQGLPLNGTIPSLSVPGLTYQLRPYTGVNALQIRGAATGTLTFATPTSATEVYVLANTVITSGSAGAGTMVVNFSDGSSHSFSPTFYNWFATTGIAAPTYIGYSPNARVQGYTTVGGTANTTNIIQSYINTSTGAAVNTPNLFEFRLALSPGEYSKTVTGVTVTGLSNSIVTLLAASVNPGNPSTCALSSGSLSVTANSATACAATSLNLVLTGVPVQLGYTYQWQYQKVSGGSWANIPTTASPGEPVTTNSTSASCTLTNQTAATKYRCVVTCASGASATSGELTVGQTDFINCYCNPPQASNNSGCATYGTVTAVSIGNGSGLTHTGITCPTAPYNSFGMVPATTATGTITQGTAYPLTVTVSNASRVAAWLDANQNGTFEASEYITSATASAAGNVTLTIPAGLTTSAALGSTKLRIRTEQNTATVLNNAANACSTTVYGETLDYVVTVAVGTACAGTPPATTATASTTGVCGGVGFTLNATGVVAGTTGLSYQWQSSPAGANTFTNLGSAQADASYAVSSLAASTDYRLIVTCTASAESTTSSAVTVARNYLNCYCNVISTGTGEYIKGVTFPGTSGFTNTTGANSTNGYGDFTGNAALTTTLNQGATYLNGVSITARVNSNGAQGGMWIDYNHSGTFETTEYISLGGANLPSRDETLATTLTVPNSALTGPTRVRVRWRNGTIGAGEACVTNTAAGCVNGCVWYGETEDYLITIAAPATCTAPPSSVVAAASTANACANSSFTLSTSSIPTTIGGYTFQWQSSPAGAGTFTNISGATTQTYTVNNQATATDYQLVVSCQFGGTPVTSNIVAVGQNAFDQCYCAVSHTSGCTNYGSISNVSIGTLNNTSGCTAAPGYVVYPVGTATTNLNAGTSATLTLTIANPGSGYRYAVWIDFNQNGTFENSEYVANSLNSTTGLRTATIVIPAGALAGPTRMRVRTKAGIAGYGDFGDGDACSAQFDGETEDYTVTIVAPTPCAGTPPTATAAASASTVCTTSPFTLTASYAGNITGLSFQWQSRTGTNAFANISGATALTYAVTSQATTTDYRFVITCANGGLTSTSNEVSVVSNFMICYCKPPAQSNIGSGEYLTNVTLGTINNSSTNPATTPVGYSDYTVSPTATQTTSLSRGGTYTISVSAQNNRQNSQALFWIDYNHNGAFDGVPEYYVVGTGPSATTGYPRQETFTRQFTVPGTALLGPTHLRVRWHNDNTSTNPCATDWYGETEEYIVDINADLVVSTTADIPAGSYSSITVTGPTGNATLTGAVAVSGAVTVQSGAALNDNCNVLSGTGSFTAAAGSTLRVCNTAGISASGATGAVQVTGTRLFSDDASYEYNGTAAQVTGTGLPVSVLNLTVNNATGATLTQSTSIERMLTLTNGNLRLGSSNLTLLSDASGTAMVVNTNGVVQNNGSGVAIMQRSATPSTSYSGPGYRHYSSPMTATPLSELGTNTFVPFVNPAYNALPTPSLPLAQFPNVFDYQESRLTATYPGFDIGWHSPSATSEVLTPGKGYTVNLAPQLVDLSGSLNSGPVNTGALTTGATANSGWQLLGNPYPAPLDWNLVTAASAVPTGMDAAVYIFEPSSQYGGFYRSYVNNAGTGGFTGIMSAMQGFFVRTSQNLPAGFSFQNAYRLTSYANPAFYRTADTRPMLRLALGGTAVNGSDETVVYLESGATATGLDKDFDAAKISNPSGLSVATRPAGTTEALAINGLPLTSATVETRLPLTLQVPAAGSYRFDVTALAHFDAGTAVLLLDHQLNTRTDLRQVTSYAFSAAQAGVLNGRFELLLGRPGSVTATAAALASPFSVWPNPATGKAALHVALDAPATSAKLTLRTLLGQEIATQTFGGSSTALPTVGLAAGTYLLTVQVAGQATATRRVVVE
ncbi:GEVED domain-containing protein [Hymenobacter sp. ASUV-10]|uniref:GEVED domain-containing protein n=1 Tax=Hymenobacter aranciens TaxID=3063996 RepID=A0ABT9B773_9BACT|nr:GEVED domain-containing protein [Hymenobacter sp. ASUV-10]MDO7874124.1 GEVED domain-containing protein [Hymenobacter sp. ASUV-10]